MTNCVYMKEERKLTNPASGVPMPPLFAPVPCARMVPGARTIAPEPGCTTHPGNGASAGEANEATEEVFALVASIPNKPTMPIKRQAPESP